MIYPQYKSKEELLITAKAASGHRVHEFNVNNRPLSKNNKGVIGQIIEEGVFHYPINSMPEADFEELGVELKVTGLKQLKNHKYVTKERLVLNIIDYMSEYNIPFSKSKFWAKNKNLLIMFYLYDYNRDDFDFLLIDSILHTFSKKDLAIIKNDWKIITDKIKNSKAHEISEADTMYLGACIKGSTSESNYRQQPNSPLKARQRAFCLKSSYTQSLVNKNLLGLKCESIISEEEIRNNTFEIAVNSKLNKYYGKSEKDLFKIFNLHNQTMKNKYNYLISCMLGLNGKNINQCEEFLKSNTILKTIRVEENGGIREHMSFPTFKYTEIIKQNFEESDLYNDMCLKRFFFVVFKKYDSVYRFEKTIFYNLPYSIIDNEIKNVFEKTKAVIMNGEIVKGKNLNGNYATNFPGSSYNHICHVRPHDRIGINKSNKGYPLPIQDKFTGLKSYTKYCFWLDKDFIQKIIQ